MNLFEKLSSEINILNFPILSPSLTDDFPEIKESEELPFYEGFSKSDLKFDENCFQINEFKVLSATTTFRRYIKYTETKIKKTFLWFTYNSTKTLTDLEEVENMVKGIKYDIGFFGGLHVYFSWVSYFITYNEEILEIDRKHYLEILRKIRKTKNTHFNKIINNKIKSIIK